MTKRLQQVVTACEECGKVLHVYASRVGVGRARYCSKECAGKQERLSALGLRRKRTSTTAGVAWGHLGALAEIMACEWLIRQGYEVFRNISAHGLADYVVWKPSEAPILIDVKSIRKSADGRWSGPRPTGAQVAAGVRLLYVDRETRKVGFNPQDVGPAKDY